MKRNNNANRVSFVRIAIAAAIATAAFYLMSRAIFVSLAGQSPLEVVFGLAFFLCEAFVMLHGLSYLWGLYRVGRGQKSEPLPRDDAAKPAVAILIPARHEPKEILESTIAAASYISYPNKQIYLLDDSSIQDYKDQARKIAEKHRCRLFRRQERHGAKAGVINDCLKEVDAKYVAIFDVDQAPMDSFLERTVPTLEANPDVAFIQTPQYYSHLIPSKVSHAANMQQAVFYEYVCEFKNLDKAVMCCGTNVILRTQALKEIGGFDETSVTEDFATSFSLHSHGWKSLYDRRVSAIGQGPLNLSTYLAQQNRWAMGNIQVFKKVLRAFFRSPVALKPIQWFEYFVTGSYYLIGWAYMVLMLMPILFVFASVPTFFMNPIVYGLVYAPYLIFAKFAFYAGMRRLGYTYPQIWQSQLLLFISLPTYVVATLAGMLGVKASFRITNKESISVIPYRLLWPQLLLCLINLSAVIWSVNRFAYERNPAVLVSGGWIAYHLLQMLSVFYFNEDLRKVSPAV
jgi:cellulose synthase (UDP-forming)